MCVRYVCEVCLCVCAVCDVYEWYVCSLCVNVV